MDVRVALGLSDDYRNGFDKIRVTFRIKGDAPAHELREVLARAQQRSAYRHVSHGVPVQFDASVE